MHFELMIDTRNFEIERRRVKHARISVGWDSRVRIIVPVAFPQAEINALIERKSEWIHKQLDYFRARKDSQVELNHDEVLFLGEVYKVLCLPELRGRTVVDDREKTISSGRALLEDGAFEKWYRKKAREIIPKRVAYLSDKYRFDYSRVFIRGQRTRWGSCSFRRNLSFNWRLIQAPMFVVDYVVVHELVHTTIMKHDKAFWMRVASICPDYKQAVEWLRHFHPGPRVV